MDGGRGGGITMRMKEAALTRLSLRAAEARDILQVAVQLRIPSPCRQSVRGDSQRLGSAPEKRGPDLEGSDLGHGALDDHVDEEGEGALRGLI
eukprot:1177152-Prorocentrum_minimum.AAC.2